MTENTVFDIWWENLPVHIPHDRRVFARMAFEAGQTAGRNLSRVQAQLDRIERRLEALTVLGMATAHGVSFAGLHASTGPKTLQDHHQGRAMAEQLSSVVNSTEAVHSEILKRTVLAGQ